MMDQFFRRQFSSIVCCLNLIVFPNLAAPVFSFTDKVPAASPLEDHAVPVEPLNTNAQEALKDTPEVRILPGALDACLMFNSNSPEIVESEGILLSTFPPSGKATAQAHLNMEFTGRFNLFVHHVARSHRDGDERTLYLGVIVGNANRHAVRLRTLAAASYDSRPDAPFIELPPLLANQKGRIYAGPGDRVSDDVLRGLKEKKFSHEIKLLPGQTAMLACEPVPVKGLVPRLNGRSMLFHVSSTGPVYAAALAQYSRREYEGNEKAPTLEDWNKLLVEGHLAGPREKCATAGEQKGNFRYGRVSGVQRGCAWRARVVDAQRGEMSQRRTGFLAVPEPGQSFSYGLSTVKAKTFGSGQIESAELLVRYGDTAYQVHGNYGVTYDLTFPLVNKGQDARQVSLSLESPVAEDDCAPLYKRHPGRKIFFRGTVLVAYKDDRGKRQVRYFHLAERQGETIGPLVSLRLGPGRGRDVRLTLVYPADATPPQAVTIATAAP